MNWISVKDRLPDDGTNNLILWCKYADNLQSRVGTNYVTDGYFRGGKFHAWFLKDVKEVDGVTHWCEVTGPEK